jgi:polyphosphate kinase
MSQGPAQPRSSHRSHTHAGHGHHGDLHDPGLFLNRELSWLEFNQRVLDEAIDPSVPILERIKFLCIFASNLDEFFMVRVAGLKQQLAGGVEELPADGHPPAEQLAMLSERAQRMVSWSFAYLMRARLS